jgi:hypothetical protein
MKMNFNCSFILKPMGRQLSKLAGLNLFYGLVRKQKGRANPETENWQTDNWKLVIYLLPGKIRRTFFKECGHTFLEIRRLARFDLAFVLKFKLLTQVVCERPVEHFLYPPD